MESQKEQDKKQDLAIQDILRRVDQLEESSAKGAAWRQPLLEGEQGAGPRTPALVTGGWSVEMEENEVKAKAEKLIGDLNLDIDLGEAFMPCRQKGFLIVPLMPKAIGAVESVRKAACPTGTVDSAGRPARVWMALSESPEQATRSATVKNKEGST